jgi:adenylate cyclase class 2
VSSRTGNQEIEIKLRLTNARQGRRLLRQAGLQVVRRRFFEANVVFDTARGDLRKRGVLLRLRQVARDSRLTYKGPALPGRHKSREEVEIEIFDPEGLQRILGQLGYMPVFRYEKYRTEHQAKGGTGLVTLDETPIGVFLELEGSPKWIDRTAGRLGFKEVDYITATYGKLYLDYCRQQGIPAHDMVFRDLHSDVVPLVKMP